MPKFISITLFESLYRSQSDLLLDDGINNFIEKLSGTEGDLIARANGIDHAAFSGFIRSLKKPTTVLFQSWVAQSPALENLLKGKGEIEQFYDNHNHLKHQLSEEYKRYISPYLAECLLKYGGKEDRSLLVKCFSYVQLLDEDHTGLVEDALFKSIQDSLKAIKSPNTSMETEQELIDIVQPLCSKQIITIVNSISKTSYALKLGYVDGMLVALERRACTPRFANWVIKQLDEVKLNDEHNYKLRDIHKGIKQGRVKFQDTRQAKFTFNWKLLLLPVVVLAVYFGVYWYFAYQAANPTEIDPMQMAENTSFQQFSKEERMKIDSLLREMEGTFEEDDMLDQGLPILGGASADLTMRREFDNDLMEDLYIDLDKDASLQAGGNNANCDTEIDFYRKAGVKNLALKNGEMEAMMRNESEFDVIVYVFDNSANGSVYSMMIKVGETRVFEMNRYDGMLLVPGDNFQTYDPPAGIDAVDLPSQKFKTHFCETDVNYADAINTAYQLTETNGGTTKFMLAGAQWSFFEIIDIYDVLEAL
ncbi:MAG: hypothetical protein QNK23_01090 [Crocinitomicaceae bacterium]|nr:hypothetical protein [Crocinitomicaceae bacterium]